MKKLCQCCRGSGKQLGGGFVRVLCEECNGSGYICLDANKNKVKDSHDEDGNKLGDAAVKVDKRSKEYKKAIKELTDQGLSDKEARKIFDEEMERLDAEG